MWPLTRLQIEPISLSGKVDKTSATETVGAGSIPPSGQP